MTAYDDFDASCPGCGRGLDPADLCEHDDGSLCPRCCTAEHAAVPYWRRSA